VEVKISKEELSILYIPERLSAVEVAKKLRFPPKANFSTKFQLDLTPYLELPISLIGRNNVGWIFLIKPTQSGGTVFLQVSVADAIDQDPGSLIYVTPNEMLTGKGMKRIEGIIEETPDLAKHIPNKRSMSKVGADLDNMKIFAAWAGSLATLSETPAKRVILDEIRLMPLTLGDESNAIKMADDRLTTYKSQGLAQGYGVSTPSVEGDLLHQQLTVHGTTVLRWAIKCWSCGKVQILNFWKNVKIIEKKPVCKCVGCGIKFDDADRKKKMNSHGLYVEIDPKKPLEVKSVEYKIRDRVICWYSSLDSPFRSWNAIYNEFITTRDKLHDYKNFIQCWLAQFWHDDVSKTSVDGLKERRDKSLERGTVPDWCKVLTGGIDTQDDGFYVTVRAWGDGKRSHLVDHFFITCHMADADAPIIHKLIKNNVEDKIYGNESNTMKWRVALYGWDTGGHRTKEVYNAVSLGLHNAIMVKGAGDNQDVTIKYNKDKNLYHVRNSEYMEETEKHSYAENFTLPDNVGRDYLRHFCNRRKKKIVNKKTGEETFIWIRVGKYDYRMAEVHAYICLDIPFEDTTFRYRLNDKDFLYNPLTKLYKEVEKDDDYYNQNEFEEEDISEYEIGGINWED